MTWLCRWRSPWGILRLMVIVFIETSITLWGIYFFKKMLLKKHRLLKHIPLYSNWWRFRFDNGLSSLSSNIISGASYWFIEVTKTNIRIKFASLTGSSSRGNTFNVFWWVKTLIWCNKQTSLTCCAARSWNLSKAGASVLPLIARIKLSADGNNFLAIKVK